MSGFAGRVGTAPNAAGRQIALPNQTIYINNINDKLSKELLRRFVYAASGARRGRTRHHHAQARDARCSTRVSVITSPCTCVATPGLPPGQVRRAWCNCRQKCGPSRAQTDGHRCGMHGAASCTSCARSSAVYWMWSP